MPFDLVEGWTAPVDYQLQAGGLSVNLVGFATCQLVLDLLDLNNNPATSTGAVTLFTASCGVVRFQPTSTMDFQARLSPYRLRYAVLDSAGRITYYPNSDAEQITVRL